MKNPWGYLHRDVAYYCAARKFADLTGRDCKGLIGYVLSDLKDDIGRSSFDDLVSAHSYSRALLSLHRRFKEEVECDRESLMTEELLSWMSLDDV